MFVVITADNIFQRQGGCCLVWGGFGIFFSLVVFCSLKDFIGRWKHGKGWVWVAPTHLFPLGMRLLCHQTSFQQSHPGAGWVLPPPLLGFETEMPHPSPCPPRGDGAPVEVPNSCPNPPVGLARLGFIFINEKNAVPSSFPSALWILRGVGCTCPAQLLAARPAFPRGNAGAGPWGWTWGMSSIPGAPAPRLLC